MPIDQAFSHQFSDLETWLVSALFLASLALVGLGYAKRGHTHELRSPGKAEHRDDLQAGLNPETKSESLGPRHCSGTTPAASRSRPEGLRSVKSAAGWSTEKTMRVLCSIIVLFAAIYIIIFDQESNADRQKWAFGAVGLVFGHWAKT